MSGERCPLRGKNDEPCKLLSPTLGRAKYFRMEKLRPLFQRLQVDHIFGRVGGVEKTESWDAVASLCPCCHRSKGRSKEIEAAYAEQWRGKESPEYLAALAEEAADAPRRKAKKKATRKKLYEKTKARAGGTPLARQKTPAKVKPAKPAKSKLPAKVLEQMQRPILNTALR